MIFARDKLRPHRIGFPRPGIARPELRQHVQHCRFARPVVDRQLDQDVVNIGLGVFDLDIEIAIIGKDAGVDQLELGVRPAAAAVLFDQSSIRESGLRILVEHPHV